ncbi:ABC transporter ATP-binding protein [Salipaludibacillus agaradhaerens]|uniref:ABC transporter ATP-binding protein n=1 Tax=Salipaludibacillus agaradhaerens TaxID=76935 RepID=A0A9Q4B185_SALAG|nr:ABC transporter ATP-binding protein [Salipaludibacillus agaradhaerens]MCR6096162.1 ABC transporter ATP-binding protein [Salipaludibacillus agaradhaerens]MCR6114279.1 ABC transporter ATP-binding protein [Salipaludibacillus agaradhaerens]
MNDRHKLLVTPLPQRETFKRLLNYAHPHWKWLLVAFFLLAGGTAAELIGPILVQIFIDDFLTPRFFPLQSLMVLGLGYISLHVLSALMNYSQLLLFQKIALRIIEKLRIDIFEKVERLGLSFFDTFPAGGLVSRITNDTEQVKELYVSVMANFLQNIMFLIGVFAAMFYLNVQLALFCLVLLPLIVVIMVLYKKFSTTYYTEMSEKLSELNARLNESIQGMTIIQLFRQERRMRKEFEEINHRHHRAWFKSIKLDGLLLRPAVDVLAICALVIVLSYFGMTSLTSPVEIGVLYAFVNYLDRFFEPVNQIMQRLSVFQQAMISAGRVFKLMDYDERGPQQIGNEDPKILKGDIEFRNVTFSYDGTKNVLNNISFRVREGETLALVGHTGSGKSSIINLLMRFYDRSAGEIYIDGSLIDHYRNEELRKSVGLVLQDPFLFVGDVASNIRLFDKKMTDNEVESAAKFVNAHTFISSLTQGYSTLVGERGGTLSSGQRQLISFARTMARTPKILILDEATSSVDTETEAVIQQALTNMSKDRTTIAIAHRLSTIKHADHIIVLHEGQIAEEGTHDELLAKKGLYEKMYLLQQGADKMGLTHEDGLNMQKG